MAGDLVTAELDPELFRMMHEAVGLWKDNISVVCQCVNIQFGFNIQTALIYKLRLGMVVDVIYVY